MSQPTSFRVVLQQVQSQSGSPLGPEIVFEIADDDSKILTPEMLGGQVSKEAMKRVVSAGAVTFRSVSGKCLMYPHDVGKGTTPFLYEELCHGFRWTVGWPSLDIQMIKGKRLVMGGVHFDIAVQVVV